TILFNWPRLMTKFPAICLALIVCVAAFSPAARAQPEENVVVKALSQVIPGAVEGRPSYNFATATVTWTNGVYVNYNDGAMVLTADRAVIKTKTGDVEADGHVRIETADMLWLGEHIRYNYKTHLMSSEEFRAGRLPVFAEGEQLTGYLLKKGATNEVTARHAFVTTDDYSDPDFEIHASTIKVIPGDKVQMWNAVAYVRGIPVFYYPYYERNIGPRANNFTTTPGYRSVYGPYLVNTYNWYLGDLADGKLLGNYYERRGPGAGPDVDLHLGQWGEAQIKYYYQHDTRSDYSTNAFPFYGNIPENRQRFYLGWQATPATNLDLKALVNYESDPLFLHDFFVSEYTQNPQPNTFVEADKYWDNWSLDTLSTPRVNTYFSQVERLPDVTLTGYRQEVLDTPVYYDSQNSVGYYRNWNAYETNGLYPGTNGYFAGSAARADTYHQLSVPWTFFDWLNVTPRVGGRLTYYSAQYLTNGLPSTEVYREVFNTGAEASFKASQSWPDATNSLLQVDGLRHIIEPSVDYAFVPDPSTPPAQLPPFDSELPSLLPLPVDFPDYNSIDSIDTMNVVRFGLRNILQTKRDGQLDDLVNWNLLLDWRLDPQAGQNNFDDLYSALSFRPRKWITFDSQVRYDIDHGNLDLAFHQITFTPNDRWSWGLSHWYLRSGFVSPDENDFIASTFYYRVNDNWGLRAAHVFNATDGRLQEQDYSIMRDLRSWTASITFRVINNLGSSTDFTVAFAFSLKAVPSTRLGEDALTSYHLVGE
ncbi:MAG TPA: LPS assembly protein LptD, partial [Candidatus Acidoferrales bacterium]|nr:LPS assembly protein LptD [Candidatus Acidoferrales bacterium]